MGFVAYLNCGEVTTGRRDEMFNFEKEERRQNVLSFGRDLSLWRKTEYANPAQKPLALAGFLIEHFSQQGTFCFDQTKFGEPLQSICR